MMVSLRATHCWYRAKGFNRENANEFYDELQTLIDMYVFDAMTTRTFSMDDPEQLSCGNLRIKKGKKQIGSLHGERGVNTTEVCCLCAGGYFVPPMVIFKRKRMGKSPKTVRAPPGSVVVNNEYGWMTN